MKSPRGGHRQAHKLCDDTAKSAETQPFLEIRQHILFPVGLDIDHPVVVQAGLGQRRCKQVRPGQTPEDVAFCARNDPGDKQGGRRAMDGIGASAGHFVQGTQGQPASREFRINLTHTERQDLVLAQGPAFKALDPGTKLGNSQVDGGFVHR